MKEYFYYSAFILNLFFTMFGLVVWSVFWMGVYRNPKQSFVAFDQWLAVCFLNDAYADETISAWTHRKHHKRTERFINGLFNDPNHCAKAYVAEMAGTQNAKEYRRG